MGDLYFGYIWNYPGFKQMKYTHAHENLHTLFMCRCIPQLIAVHQKSSDSRPAQKVSEEFKRLVFNISKCESQLISSLQADDL